VDERAHWETVYRTKREDEVSWYQREPTFSLELIRQAAPEQSARIIDVGGGTSTLVDALLRAGYARPSVLDLSATALNKLSGAQRVRRSTNARMKAGPSTLIAICALDWPPLTGSVSPSGATATCSGTSS
jgi:predicted lipoprotein with Yx(FWY)xxD motif